jgi:hypothetical protein
MELNTKNAVAKVDEAGARVPSHDTRSVLGGPEDLEIRRGGRERASPA